MQFVDRAFGARWLTNGGPLHQELTDRLSEYLGVENLLLVANGTLALQIAMHVLGAKSRVITSPFTFAASASSALWMGMDVEYVDVDRSTYCLNPDLVEVSMRRGGVGAVLPVHVFGRAAYTDEFEQMCAQHNVPLIFDASHAFDSRDARGQVLARGDASTISFHATKLFHTAEGGAVVFRDPAHFAMAEEAIDFGIDRSTRLPKSLGINAKLSELHCAMGLAILDDMPDVVERRRSLAERYQRELGSLVGYQAWTPDQIRNGSYMPILLEDADTRALVEECLEQSGIASRRYFYPSLDTIDALNPGRQECKVSRQIAERILCLPVHFSLDDEDVDWVCNLIRKSIREKS